MADETILVSVDYDTDEAQTSVVDLTDDIFKLNEANKALRQEQKKFKSNTEKNIEVRKNLNRQIEANKDALKRTRKERNESLRVIKKEQSSFQKLGKTLKSTATSYLGVAAAIGFVIKGLVNIIKNSAAFEKALSSLSAITGAIGEDLKFFEDAAKKFSGQTLQSATEILQAFELVGSARPELLKNSVALAEVTKQAIILSEATGGKLGLVESADAVTTVMNQMGQASGEASRIINILAAGSKFGSAQIPFLTEALEKAGTTANLMGLSVEEVTGALEANAKFFKKASVLGNSFDKVLLKLKETQIGYKSGTFDLNDAIDELREKYENGTDAADIFGVEHAKLGELLVLNQGKFNEFTESVTGTTTALEQQEIQNDNLAGSWKKLTNTIETSLLTGTGGLNKLVKVTRDAIIEINNLDLIFKRTSKLTEDQVSRTFDVLNTLSNRQGRRFREALKGFQDITEEGLKIEKEAILESLDEAGFSRKEREKLFDEFARRRLEQIELDKQSEIESEKLKAEAAIAEEKAKQKKLAEIRKAADDKASKEELARRDRKLESEINQDIATTERAEKSAETEAERRDRELEFEINQDIAATERATALEEIKTEIAKEGVEKRREFLAQSIAEIGSLTNDFANFLIASNDNRLNSELEAEERKRDKALELAGDDAEKREKIEADFEKKKLKLQKKAAKQNQKIQIGNAIVQGAIVVLNALSTSPFIPAGLIAAAGAAIATGLQIATIKQQSFAKGGQAHLPRAARGMQVSTLSGATHAGGGVQLSADGIPFAEAQRDENVYVVNKDASDYINALSSINQGIGGGVPLSRKSGHMQSGGQADVEAAQQPDFDINDITERVIKNLPPIITRVESIKTGIEQFDEVIDVSVI